MHYSIQKDTCIRSRVLQAEDTSAAEQVAAPYNQKSSPRQLSAWDLQAIPGETRRTGPKYIVERSKLCNMFH